MRAVLLCLGRRRWFSIAAPVFGDTETFLVKRIVRCISLSELESSRGSFVYTLSAGTSMLNLNYRKGA